MRPGESVIEMARRHVAEGEAHVRKQKHIVERLRQSGLPTEVAEELLGEFEHTLADHRRSLARMERERDQGLRDKAGNPQR